MLSFLILAQVTEFCPHSYYFMNCVFGKLGLEYPLQMITSKLEILVFGPVGQTLGLAPAGQALSHRAASPSPQVKPWKVTCVIPLTEVLSSKHLSVHSRQVKPLLLRIESVLY